MAYFPMMIALEDKNCLVVGGGAVAYRKVQVLCEFGARVTVISPCIEKEIQGMQQIRIKRNQFSKADLEGVFLVVAATDDKEENHRICTVCRKKHILVNVVDQPEDCDFIFPSYRKEGDVVAAFSSGGKSPVLTQYLKEQTRDLVTPGLGRVADALGEVRKEVKKRVVSEADRKYIFRELFSFLLALDEIPEKKILLKKIENMAKKQEGKRGESCGTGKTVTE